MRLSSLLDVLQDELTAAPEPSGDDPIIRGITYDSRAVAPGDLFVALEGSISDGHDYLAGAVRLGASALLVQNVEKARAALSTTGSSVPVIAVRDSRRALAPLAIRFFGAPAGELALVGITGTNGKTSTAYLAESILAHARVPVGLVGTVEIRYAGERQRAVNTTPESLDLQRVLRAMRTRGIEAVVMEVSSHGLELGRVSGCTFRVGALTNLTQDHLDFHGDMDSYRDSKLRLFRDHLDAGSTAVINVDDASGEHFVAAATGAGARVLRVSRGRGAEIRLVDARIERSGTRARVELEGAPVELELPLLGDFNLENMLVSCGIGHALGVAPEAIAEGVASCPQVPGRMELVALGSGDAPTVIVDYAHTPDAVAKLLAAVRPLSQGRLITVFGCGGDRDRAKRPLMARAVSRLSDRVVATSDNPRTEDPDQILADVESGLEGLTRVAPDALDRSEHAYAVDPDRRAAIELAIGIARPEDAVVLAGKGHEDYQIVGREKLPFDDRAEAARVLASRGPGAQP